MIVYKKPIGKMVNALNKLLEIIKEDAENLAIELTEKFIETGNFEDATDEYIENFVDKDLK